jgi:release factor glutamine methyltransferase
LSDILSDATTRLADAGISSPRREARILLGHVLGISPSDVLTSPPETVIANIRPRYFAAIERRVTHEPLAYITGEKEFWSIPLHVAPGVLIPRPETETLMEELCTAVPDRNAPLSILDLGTGSGCLLVAALHEYPRARGVGIDSSDTAIAIAGQNLIAQGLAARADLLKGDFSRASRRFDVILSNPPYIPSAYIAGLEPDVRAFEPLAALDGGPDGLAAYRLLAGLLPNLLAKGGLGFLEIGVGQGETVPALMAAAGLENRGVAPDLAGIPRCVILGAPG